MLARVLTPAAVAMPEISSSQPTIDDAAPVILSQACEGCGCPVEIGDQFCPACGSPQAGAAPGGEPAAEQRHFRCENCGAEVGVDPDQRSYTCAFCDSTYVVEFTPEETGRQPPEFVIGFSVTPERAQEKFREWLLGNSWFRPSDLKLAKIEEKLKGVYLPFWSFSMLAESDWSADIGEYWWRTETYTTTDKDGKTVTKTRRVRETEWWNLGGDHHRYYSGYLVSGSRGLSQEYADRIKPFHLPALKRYRPDFLAGWLSEEYSIERDAALGMCKQEFQNREQQNVAAHLPGDTHRNLRVGTRFSQINSDLILLPIYLLSYRYRDKLYRFMVNGQTGRVAGNKPLSKLRIALATAAGVIAVGILLLLLMLLR
jgi:hypothetical protein